MKITLDLPEYDARQYLYEVDGSITPYGNCTGCGDELYGLVGRLHPTGWVHTEKEEGEDGKTCLEKAVDQITSDPVVGWQAVAAHVAKSPSRHTASTVRAVITELLAQVKGGAANA